MDRGERARLGMLATWPPTFYAILITEAWTGGTSGTPVWVASLAVLTILLNIVLAAYFAWHAGRDATLSGGERTEWILALLICFPFTTPLYWYRRIWRAA